MSRMMTDDHNAHHDQDGVHEKRNGKDQGYEHPLGVEVLEIGEGPAGGNVVLFI